MDEDDILEDDELLADDDVLVLIQDARREWDTSQ
jgi:hypothetical protein